MLIPGSGVFAIEVHVGRGADKLGLLMTNGFQIPNAPGIRTWLNKRVKEKSLVADEEDRV